jgi:hypothetical protein
MTLPLNITPASILSNTGSVGSILSTLTKTDQVQVLDQQTLTQIFSGARPLQAEIKEYAKVMNYPVETGVTLSDHRISMPTEISLLCIIPSASYATDFIAIRNAWQAATLLSVQTRVGTYKNMIIEELPHKEDSELFTAITIYIKLREVIMIAPSSTAPAGTVSNFSPANPKNSTNVQSGLISATNLTSSGLSYLHAGTVFGVGI